jgi:4-amino-4-deoxy-L-arabinose transferase-like glycosyltransferase
VSRRRDLGASVLTAFALAASFLVLAAYAERTVALAAYPWDWSPDEGLSLDYGRRALRAPESLYTRSVSPFPSAYGPVLPALLAPIVALSAQPLRPARLLALAWTLAGALAVYALVRRRGSRTAGLAAAALSLAPFDLTFWYVLVRVDGLMVALWLTAAAVLLPARLEKGADRLGTGRLVAGTALLLSAVLAKPTAVLHGTPLVLGWWLVDRRSAWRLAAAVSASGLLALAALQWASGGGFLWVNRLWALHPSQPGLREIVLSGFIGSAWPLVLLCALLALGRAHDGAGSDRREPPLARESALLLLAGGLLAVPALSKEGAWWNYLLPLLAALAVLAGHLASRGGAAGPGAAARSVALAVVALALAATRTFPLPTAEDERTARVLYDYVEEHVARTPGPILVSRPDLASFLVGQPAEIEGSSYVHLAAARAPGTERVLGRLQRREYTLLVETWPLPRFGGYGEAIEAGYTFAGGCIVGYFYGPTAVHVRPRRDLPHPMIPRVGTRCGSAPPGLEKPREP